MAEAETELPTLDVLELLRAHAKFGAEREIAGSWIAMEDIDTIIAALDRAEIAEREANAAPKLILEQARRADDAEKRAERLEAALRKIDQKGMPGWIRKIAADALAPAPDKEDG